ncbi:hypothetical protein GJ744_001671 [Endocarpon pusillum]|uniref:Dihydrolipoamide acetyltransferase component of pyruvate dehydrogenase complex n=1 Tax=Endocarpon pusillum TaxID=364733 RepID=A0A8H7A994_9EURO|nr:hypothetical protein GJ744_001671 [Endocarpon pusillum]
MKRWPVRSTVGLPHSHYYIPRIRPIDKSPLFRRKFQSGACWSAIRTQKLGDVGEGITECMLNMWFVEEGARVEEWDKLCEMQSDKAAVEISASYAGVIKKLYAQADDMVKTGAPLADIDDGLPVEEGSAAETSQEHQEDGPSHSNRDEKGEQVKIEAGAGEEGGTQRRASAEADLNDEMRSDRSLLATPAVRGLLKQHNIDISKLNGSGNEGRILTEDVQAYLENQKESPLSSSAARSTQAVESEQSETIQPLSRVQSQMFRTMTASLAIPHFLYSDEVNITRLSGLRKRLNLSRETQDTNISLLAFILKAVSVSLNQNPLLNARLDAADNLGKPQLIYRRNHNIGIAMDTPAGLFVPVVKNVGALSILDIAYEIRRLSQLGNAKKLSPAHLSGGTITVSNIGSIGGTVVAPIITEGQVAILGVGKARVAPVFGQGDLVERAEIANFSWSADHRIIDGATLARMGSMVKHFIEDPEKLMVFMR